MKIINDIKMNKKNKISDDLFKEDSLANFDRVDTLIKQDSYNSD
jgi:hypothetical protein